MQALEQLKTHFQAYVWTHVLSILVGLMLLRQAKTLTALQCQESVPTLSRTLNVYDWPLEELIATRRQLVTHALQKHHRHRRGRRPMVYLIIDDTVVPKRGKKLPLLGLHFSPSQDRVVRGWDLVFAAVRVGSFMAPWDWRCYVNERFSKEEDFRRRTELAAELIRSFVPPLEGRVIVLVDSTYCCSPVIRPGKGLFCSGLGEEEPPLGRWAAGLGRSRGDGRLPTGVGDPGQDHPSRAGEGAADGDFNRSGGRPKNCVKGRVTVALDRMGSGGDRDGKAQRRNAARAGTVPGP